MNKILKDLETTKINLIIFRSKFFWKRRSLPFRKVYDFLPRRKILSSDNIRRIFDNEP